MVFDVRMCRPDVDGGLVCVNAKGGSGEDE